MDYVSGEILTPEGFQKGYLGFKDKTIEEKGKGEPPSKPICKGLITPSFVNAHTHLGDSFIRKKDIKLPRNIKELVAPPNGLKHRLLSKASQEEILDGMKESIEIMSQTGVSCFCDFRENGIKGVKLIKKALRNSTITSLILSRPEKLEYDPKEIELLINNSDGIGLSSILDWDYSEIGKVAKHVKKRGKIFSIHASERIREDIDLILDLKPDFLIHMTCANEEDFTMVKNNNIPIVVCPRSNAFFGLKPKYKIMKKIGVEIILGTDNAMLNQPSILAEIIYIKNSIDIFTLEELLNMITYSPRKALNQDYGILGLNSQADFVVLEKKHLKPIYISAN